MYVKELNSNVSKKRTRAKKFIMNLWKLKDEKYSVKTQTYTTVTSRQKCENKRKHKK